MTSEEWNKVKDSYVTVVEERIENEKDLSAFMTKHQLDYFRQDAPLV